MSLKRRRSDSHGATATTSEAPTTHVFISEPIEDRTSTFVGYFSPTLNPKTLQKRDEIKSASHRMLAWRTRSSSQRTIIPGQRKLETGFDDDGEQYGGKKVLSVLESMQVEGSLVVARWYGGIMLGPVRFTHMETCARDAVKAWQHHQQSIFQERARLETEEKERARLVTELQDRDSSILSLRSLLDTKNRPMTAEKSNADSQTATTVSAPQARKMDYGSLPLSRLRMLDRARDSTITFLLKKIDAAEKKDEEVPPSSLGH